MARTTLVLVLATLAAAGCSQAPIERSGEGAQASTGLLALTVNISTSTGNYLVADQGGGAALMAYSTWAKGWETFTLQDLTQTTLTDGDVVTLQGGQGQWASADNGGGGAITVTAPWQRGWEEFTIHKLGGGAATIGDGDTFALETSVGGQFVSADNGGGSDVTATAPWERGWETFTLHVVGGGGTAGGSGGGAGGGSGSGGSGGGSTGSLHDELLAYLQGISGHQTMAGEHQDESDRGDFIQAMDDVTGHYPALWGGDFLFEQDQIDNRPNVIAHMQQGYRGGAVISLMYHACPPTGPESCDWGPSSGGVLSSLSDAQWSDLVTDGGMLNAVWKSRLDAIAPYFQQLKDAGMPALFRPHHEMNQGVFWWAGRKGNGGTAALYRVTHDYLVKDKGLDNIVWVWSVQDIWDDATSSWNFEAYDPGDAYWDVMSLDFYDGAGFTQGKYDAMLAVAGNKPIAIGECPFLPAPGDLASQPRWVYFMGWAELVQQNMSNAAIAATYAAPSVLTQDRMPGW
jgi:hypothetical protein